jgi:glycerate kinase
MRVVIAPDSFKGTLTAPQATEAIAQGWLLGRPHDLVIGCPLSDGGDGLLIAIAEAGGPAGPGPSPTADVCGASRRPAQEITRSSTPRGRNNVCRIDAVGTGTPALDCPSQRRRRTARTSGVERRAKGRAP